MSPFGCYCHVLVISWREGEFGIYLRWVNKPLSHNVLTHFKLLLRVAYLSPLPVFLPHVAHLGY